MSPQTEQRERRESNALLKTTFVGVENTRELWIFRVQIRWLFLIYWRIHVWCNYLNNSLSIGGDCGAFTSDKDALTISAKCKYKYLMWYRIMYFIYTFLYQLFHKYYVIPQKAVPFGTSATASEQRCVCCWNSTLVSRLQTQEWSRPPVWTIRQKVFVGA